MYTFYYYITYFSETDNKIYEAKGLTFASTYPEAVERLCDWYGDKDIDEIRGLKAINDKGLIEFNEHDKIVYDELEEDF